MPTTHAPNARPAPPFPAQHQEPPGLESELEPRPSFEAGTYRGAGKLEGKIALVTGGDSGIGRAVSVLFAREGASVAIVFLPEEQRDAEETKAAVEQEGSTALLCPGDVTDPDFCRRAVEETVARFGQLDVLVNNAAFQRISQTSTRSPRSNGSERFERTSSDTSTWRRPRSDICRPAPRSSTPGRSRGSTATRS